MTNSETADLIKKLSLKDAKSAYILHGPSGYALPEVEELANISELPEAAIWVQAFYDQEANLTHELPTIEARLAKDGRLWICWPKRSANKGSNLSDNVVRSIGLACGLVDTKVASIDKTWSGLMFVYRKSDR